MPVLVSFLCCIHYWDVHHFQKRYLSLQRVMLTYYIVSLHCSCWWAFLHLCASRDGGQCYYVFLTMLLCLPQYISTIFLRKYLSLNLHLTDSPRLSDSNSLKPAYFPPLTMGSYQLCDSVGFLGDANSDLTAWISPQLALFLPILILSKHSSSMILNILSKSSSLNWKSPNWDSFTFQHYKTWVTMFSNKLAGVFQLQGLRPKCIKYNPLAIILEMFFSGAENYGMKDTYFPS